MGQSDATRLGLSTLRSAVTETGDSPSAFAARRRQRPVIRKHHLGRRPFLLSPAVAAVHKAWMNYVLVATIGLFSGVMSGLFGVGGGIIMVPAMVFLLKLDPKVAIGTSLLVIIPTAMMGCFQHHILGHVNWKVALVLAPLAIVGGWLGAKLTEPIHAENLKQAFGGFLIVVGIYMAFIKA